MTLPCRRALCGITMDKKDYQQPQKDFWKVVATLLVITLAAMMFLASCGTVRYVDRVVVQHDTTRIVQRDSIRFYDRDSVFIREKGDTVYQYVEKWRWRDRVRVDTVLRVRVDSVAVVKKEIVSVEKALSAWQKWQIRGFWYISAALLLALAVWLVKRKLKL